MHAYDSAATEQHIELLQKTENLLQNTLISPRE